MANNKFDVKNDTTILDHTETDNLDGTTTLGLSGLAPDTTYDKVQVYYAGKEVGTPATFKTKAAEAVAVTGIKITSTVVTGKVGDDLTLSAEVLPENATNKNITWQSGDESLAAFTKTGAPSGSKILTLLKAGKVTITVTTEDGAKVATVEITITAA